MSGVDRRAFLALGGAAVAAAAFAACTHGPSEPDVDLGALRDIYSDRGRIEPVGKLAVDVQGIGTRQHAIAAALSPDGSAGGLGTARERPLRRHLERSIADDFARGRTVDVGGWELPLTEARVAALVYLTN